MNKIKYILRRISTINFKKMKEIINKIHEEQNKSKVYIFFDMVICAIKYGAGYIDYNAFEMYNLNKEQRKTILTRTKNDKLIRKLNPKEYWDVIDNKALFNERFKKYLNRDFIVLNDNYDDFIKFLKNKDEIIVKPLDATCGIGVEKVDITKEKDLKELYRRLIENKQNLVEEVASQHKDISLLHPDSINTIRMVTINNKYGVVSLVCAIFRIGTNHHIVDNFHCEGICVPIDIEKGIISGNAVNRKSEKFEVHPTTKIKLLGYKIPLFDKAKELVIEAHKTIPELGIIGWDVCIGENKPCIIEANQYPGYDLYHTINTKDKQGVIPLFEEALNKKK